ncbi:PREDICTED: pentatricopeptide repeat-containing protein At1g05670, mitochondrial-like [Nelumbo nucifera]|uniref:Uncharacterized protein n=2 Tax=Nelumbo nucifera TaxID=4432 RepID=A0A822ZB96_NELNU|nr:PREDICTED: pentatricopeptide repeat-containing protein At1g05670, mitochondrial-like [Nelumbo nucifera]DAD40911.1 TPA_asm: hypothetical protein HUJ06_015234 [Nelumbo nucifera]
MRSYYYSLPSFFPSRVFSKFPVIGIKPAPGRPIHAVQGEISFNQTTASVSPKKIGRVFYLKEFCALIRNLSNNNRNHEALSALDLMLTKTHYFDSATSVLVIDGLSRLRMLGRAKALLKNLRSNGKVSDYFLYSLVIHCLVNVGRIEDADSFWNEVCGSDLSSDRRIDSSEFVIYLCKFGRDLEIERICDRVLMGGGALRFQSYIALIGALCRESKGHLAKAVLQEMKRKGLKPDNLTYLIMFQCFCRNGELSEADSILRKLVRRKYDMDICIYGSFIYGLCKSSKYREADKLFKRLIKVDDSGVSGNGSLKQGRRAIFQLNCKGAVPEIMAYEYYCRSLCDMGKLDEAETLLKEMMRKRTVPEGCVYRSFIKALFQAGRDEDAIRFFNAMKKKGFVRQEEIAGFIVMGLCEMDRVDDAWMIFYDIFVKGSVLVERSISNCLIGSYLKVRRLGEAERLFERMKEGSFGGLDASTYVVFVNGLCEQGELTNALLVFDEMLEKKIPVNGTIYEVILRGLCTCGRIEEAHMYLNKMIENGHLVSYSRWKVLLDSVFVGNENDLSLEF